MANARELWLHLLKKRRISLLVGACAGAFLTFSFFYLQNDIHRNYLDPKVPFQIYRPPPAPDYHAAGSWFLNPAIAGYYADPRKVDVFFVHATSFDGGKAWLGSIGDRVSDAEVERAQLPNYAGPFAVIGNVYAPKYRQASLYTQLTLREDAGEARQFAYRDVELAFRTFLRTRKGGRGFVLVGVEQGGLLTERLLRDVVAPDPELKSNLVAAYLLETLVPAKLHETGTNFPACANREATACVVSYVTAGGGRPDRVLQVLQKSVYWQGGDALVAVGSQKALCVNPLAGGVTDQPVAAHQSLGATNATGLEWGMEPAVIARKVSARCIGGLLFVDKPKSASFNDSGTWEEQRKVNRYNLFYGDLQADVQARLTAYRTRP